MELITHNLAPIMFMGLIVFLLMGFPVAFSLGACGLFFGTIGVELGVLPEALLQALPLRIFGIMQNDTLLAIPFFTLMGLILERSGMAEDLLDTIGQLFGPVRGGLALAVIFVGALLAATTGVVAASVISMGLISLPIMLRYGYDRRVASGVIAASGTLAQIIPPSLVLIILADQLGRSVGDMYKGAFIPGFMLTGFYAGYVILLAFFRPAWVPALPLEARTIREDNGKSGLPSLLVLTIISTALAVTLGKNWGVVLGVDEGRRARGGAAGRDHRRRPCARGVLLAFLIAVVNKVHAPGPAVAHGRTRDLRADPAAAADLPGAGHHLPGHRDADRRRRDGRHGRDHHGDRPWATELHAAEAGAQHHHQAGLLRGVHPGRLDHVQPGVPGRGRPEVGGAPADRPARRADRLPDRGQPADLLPGFLPGLLRAVLHRGAAAGAGGRQAGRRPDLVRRAAGREHADFVHAPAVRLCPVLPAQRGAGQGIHRPPHARS